jgi:flavodoxin
MKILIVYDSRHGNTERIARTIQDVIHKTNEVQLKKVKDTSSEDLYNIDFLVVGSPTHGGRASKNTKQFFYSLADNSLTKIKAATYDTGLSVNGPKRFMRNVFRLLGYTSENTTKMLKEKGAKIITSKTFFILKKEGALVKGEIKRAEKWAEHTLNTK